MTEQFSAVDKWRRIFPTAKPCIAEYFIDGEEYFGELVSSIEATKSSKNYICILGWMLDLDFKFQLLGRGLVSFGEVLKAAANRGVKIYVLVWDNVLYYDSIKILRNHSLGKHSNVSIHICHNKFSSRDSSKFVLGVRNLLRKYLDSKTDLFQLLSTSNVTKLANRFLIDLDTYIQWVNNSGYSVASHHEKVIIIKNGNVLTGYCGGFDLNENRITTPNSPIKLHDVACKVVGDAATELLKRFERRWNDCDNTSVLSLVSDHLVTIFPAVQTPVVLPHLATRVGTYNSPVRVSKDSSERSLRDAYFKIIDSANNFIYIEGQYVTNLDVAVRINKRLRLGHLKLVLIATQENSEALNDTFMPHKIRTSFIETLTRGLSAKQKEKVLYTVIDKSIKVSPPFHFSQHSKVLIVDDEIALVGSANVNQRSFTLDSESSLVVIDPILVKKLRVDLWMHTILHKHNRSQLRIIFHKDFMALAMIIRVKRGMSYLKLYQSPDVQDLNISLAQDNKLIFGGFNASTFGRDLIYIMIENGLIPAIKDKSLYTSPFKSNPLAHSNLRQRAPRLSRSELLSEFIVINILVRPSKRPDYFEEIMDFVVDIALDPHVS